MGAELDISQQIDFIDSILWYDKERLEATNPFIGISASALLTSIRKSLIELQEIKSKNLRQK